MVRGWATGGLFLALVASGCSFHAHAVGGGDGAPMTPPDLALAMAGADLADNSTAIDLAMPASTTVDMAPVSAPMLMVTRANPPMGSTVNLTTEGTFDWVQFGDPTQITDVNRLSGGPTAIVQTVNGSEMQYGAYADRFSWSNGAPMQNEPGTTTGVYVRSTNSNFVLTLPAGAAPHTARLYLSQFKSTSQITVHLSDGSKPDFTEMQTVGNAELYSKYTIVYAAAADGAQLVITWLLQADGGNGSVDVHAASLQ